MFEQIFVALVSFLGRGETGELAHGKKFAAISGRVYAARIRRLAGITEILIVIPVFRQISLGVQPANGNVGDGREAWMAVFVAVCTGRRTDRALRRLFECGRERRFR